MDKIKEAKVFSNAFVTTNEFDLSNLEINFSVNTSFSRNLLINFLYISKITILNLFSIKLFSKEKFIISNSFSSSILKLFL